MMHDVDDTRWWRIDLDVLVLFVLVRTSWVYLWRQQNRIKRLYTISSPSTRATAHINYIERPDMNMLHITVRRARSIEMDANIKQNRLDK